MHGKTLIETINCHEGIELVIVNVIFTASIQLGAPRMNMSHTTGKSKWNSIDRVSDLVGGR